MEQINRTIVVGSEANLIKPAPKIEGEASHRWRVFVQDIYGHDVSGWVSYVKFELHHTFNNASRIIRKPPFEVNEKGWGEFDIMVTIYIKYDEAKHISFKHSLKLHSTKLKKGKPEYPLFSCFYHDFVLSNLSREASNNLLRYPQTVERPLLRGQEPDIVEVFPLIEDDELAECMNNAHNDIKLKINQALNVYNATQAEIARTKTEISDLEAKEKYAFGNQQFSQRSINKT
jgi:transcription initiation factor IIF auxiliary subunit